MMKKRIIIVSNEPFSDISSNGRTIKNFLLNVPRENLAQFYIHGKPDEVFCENYFCVPDRMALNRFLGRKAPSGGQSKASPKGTAPKAAATKQPKRSYRNLVIRNVVWQSMRWWDGEFDRFLQEFRPDIVLLQAGDAPFMFRIARRIAKKCHAKLMMFNTEHYVLKKQMYASANSKLWHDILMYSLKRQYRKMMNKVDFCLYNTEALEKAYQERYPHPGKSAVLYTTSTLSAMQEHSGESFSALYCGNLGVGRLTALDEFAKVLYGVDNTARLDIYGTFPDEQQKKRLCQNPNVYCHGFVDYQQIPALMERASILIHCEHPERVENLKFAFSTKIADCLACGRPFLVYASCKYPFVQYLLKNKCAHIASDPEELRVVLKNCIQDKDYLYQHVRNAVEVASRNHNQEMNCRIIEEIFNTI